MSINPVCLQRASLSSAGLLCLIAGLSPTAAQAQFITNSPDPFQGSVVTLQSPAPQFYGLGYAQTVTLDSITETNNTITGGNDVIDYNAGLDAPYYTTPALTTVAGALSLTGSFEVTLFGRINPFEIGIFSYQIDSISFSGTLAGHTLTLELNPSQISQGTTTITPGPGLGQYTITAPALVYGQRIVDGGSPIAGTPFQLTVGAPPSAVPEPGLASMTALVGVGGLLTWRRNRRRN
jgi:hypothetical protein